MRTEEFKMERHGLLKEGDKVEIIEKSTEAFYYYTIVPALAMSGNYKLGERIKSTKGVVKDVRQDPRGYFVDVEFEE
ncbi:MAG: hypothetical protein K6E85_01135 [Lachnospiraceae bacterium]|nr:hypothetical protein [Lachnospiraceae bacterium]MCR5321880.1 hypothetical protein [Lachnospiraceae bacterium]